MRSSHRHQSIQRLCEGAMLLALSVVLHSWSKLLFANLPHGGSVTLALFPLLWYAYRWGVGCGMLMGLAAGAMDLLLDGAYAWGWQSIVLDYLLAYPMMGFCGLFRKVRWGIFPGIVVGCLARFGVHYLSGITLYRILVPTPLAGLGVFSNPYGYALLYNGLYMLPNMVIALLIAALLAVPLKRYHRGVPC